MSTIDQSTNTLIILDYKKKVRKLTKQIKEVQSSVTFFTNNTFDDIPSTYVSELKVKLNKLSNEVTKYSNLISGLQSLSI